MRRAACLGHRGNVLIDLALHCQISLMRGFRVNSIWHVDLKRDKTWEWKWLCLLPIQHKVPLVYWNLMSCNVSPLRHPTLAAQKVGLKVSNTAIHTGIIS